MDFCKNNNLFRDSSLNTNPEIKGFFETNRRVRAQPFLKVKSEGYFASKESISYTGINPHTLSLGMQFDILNGIPICNKYISEETKKAQGNSSTKQYKKDYAPLFEKHVDSDQFKYNIDKIPLGSLLSFHAKVHGTSFRVANTLVNVELPKWKRLLTKLTPIFPTQKWEIVVGTRNTILKNEGDKGFYGNEGFRFEVAKSLTPYLEKGMTIYGEIAGYANGKPIMPSHSTEALKNKEFSKKYGKSVIYKYGCKDHQYRFHIYRITHLTQSGVNIDLSQKQLEKWCNDRELLCTEDVYPTMIYDGNKESLFELVSELTERPLLHTEDYIDPEHPSEGVIIRCDDGAYIPKFYKNKSYAFRIMEGLCKDVDTEDAN